MAQKVQTLLIDDIDGSEAEATVPFGLDGASYEIDLSAAHAADLGTQPPLLGSHAAPQRAITAAATAVPSDTMMVSSTQDRSLPLGRGSAVPADFDVLC